MVGLAAAGVQIQRSCLTARSGMPSSMLSKASSDVWAWVQASRVRGSCPSTVSDSSSGLCSSRPSSGGPVTGASVRRRAAKISIRAWFPGRFHNTQVIWLWRIKSLPARSRERESSTCGESGKMLGRRTVSSESTGNNKTKGTSESK
jgi:hypothetical protein